MNKIAKKIWWVAALFAFVVAAALYMHGIVTWSLWFDEAFSAALIKESPWELIKLTAADVHPPLYYLLLKVWTLLFGMSEMALRSFSAVCMIGAFGVGFGLVRRYFGVWASYAVLPFVVLAPFLLRYGQEARMYGLATLICFNATYAMLRARESERKIWWILYGVLVAAGMYVHYYTALIWIAHWVWHWYMVRQTPGARFFDRRWIGAYVLAVLLYLPWLPVFLVQANAVQGGFWIGPVSQDSLTSIATNFLFYLQESQVKNWLSVILVALVGGWLVLFYKTYNELRGAKKQYFVLLLLMGFLPAALLFVLSLPPFQPVFVERYFVPSMLGIALLMGVAVALGPKTRRCLMFRISLAVITVAVLIFGVHNVYRADGQHSQSHAKELAAHLQSNLGVNDALVVTSPYTYFEFAYYDTGKTYFADPEHVVGVIGSANLYVGSPYLVHDLASFGATKDDIWLVGPQDIILEAPASWVHLETIQMGGQKAIRYQTN